MEHEALLIPILALMVPIVVAPVAIYFKFEKAKRELEHAERMKALEFGRTLPGDETWSSPGRISLAIGAGVPVCVFGLAWLTSQAVGFRSDIWQGASMVGCTSVICGTILAAKTFSHRAREAATAMYQKPSLDPDAYDVAGSRGGPVLGS
jgi:hypothetical protein